MPGWATHRLEWLVAAKYIRDCGPCRRSKSRQKLTREHLTPKRNWLSGGYGRVHKSTRVLISGRTVSTAVSRSRTSTSERHRHGHAGDGDIVAWSLSELRLPVMKRCVRMYLLTPRIMVRKILWRPPNIRRRRVEVARETRTLLHLVVPELLHLLHEQNPHLVDLVLQACNILVLLALILRCCRCRGGDLSPCASCGLCALSLHLLSLLTEAHVLHLGRVLATEVGDVH